MLADSDKSNEGSEYSKYAVSMKNIYKYFDTFCVLRDIRFNVKRGSIHALLGENGAGKSTMMNILYGLYHADEGEIFINGKSVNIKNPNIAINMGIGMVHQHFMLIEPLTVIQNIMLGKETTNKIGMIKNNKVRQEIIDLSKKYGLVIDPDAKIEDISIGMQQRVEILKTLYRGAEILILDEPTAVLTPQETEELIEVMNNLVKNGKTIIIITHKLKEIKRAADYCTVIRKGKYIDTVKVKDVSESQLATMMVGRDVNLHVNKQPASPKETVFEVSDLFVQDTRGIDKVKNLSLQVRKGEIVGIAGIEGNGQKELVEAITNLISTKSGCIKINGEEIQNTSPRNVINSKIGTIPEDRHKMGLVLDFTVAENAVLINYGSPEFCKSGFLRLKNIDQFAELIIKDFDIRPNHCKNLSARALSGGNQQKIIIAREVVNNPDLLIAVQPTRGLDVGAIEFVHKSLIEQRDKGKAILLISLELDEIMDLSDRIAVIYDGKIVDVVENTKDIDENKIGLLMAGGRS